jgi:putative membrane protein insertion efficiency factor
MKSLGAVLALPVRFYRRYLSPWKPAMCRFQPTCSQYAIEALELHGVVRGGYLTLWRLLRCQPFGRPGFDPVPPKGRALQRNAAQLSHGQCSSKSTAPESRATDEA